ncbi:ShlB/FhaC/HecB family hemolysin secretion/activation protein [Candidatus Methylobacter oryzae]|uniref:ShlB/FhaC/HecB family hemolysin secretion/activation protein n=1 Tax=Candidatus Methylobacter oryzae TaxID=2497749 RepID=A0ABY3C8D4_9GAMM|nr:ShlB/FhaC/HecB family hemolysin secretion/activation protein [Candidatus Methylobacter oryzae]TRW92859.1 ShlB/FhaC/HecB family hemolysin secretion/activation protein [Candidatus Methylobacter oryzae]
MFTIRNQPQAVLAALFFVSSAQPVWAVGGAESMDRPSARSLPTPGYAPNKPPENFSLPPVPEPVGKNVDRRKLFVKHINLEGNSVFPEQDLGSIVHPYEQREVSIAELEELRQKLTRYYIDHGYVNSGAVIPADAFKDGELHINIVEGRLDEVRVKGLERLREGYVINRLSDGPDKPFNLQALQDNYQLLLSDPLITRMNGRILPGATPGHSILDLDVVRAKPYQLSFFGNNQRPPSIGAEAFGLNGQLRNLTGLGDILDFTYITSDGSDRYAGGFSVPVTDWGTQVFFHFDEGDSMVLEEPIRNIDIKSQVHSLEGGVSHPIINTLRQRLNLGIMLAVRENETSLMGRSFSFVPGEPTGRNQATVWRLFQDYSQRWDNHALAFRSTFSVGMNALGATPERPVPDNLRSLYRQYPDSEFFAWLGQAQYAWRMLDNGSQFVLRGNAQFSDDPLLPLERIAVGGLNTVRGYRENQLVRDQGYTMSAEFHFPVIGGSDPGARHHLTLIPFADYGRAWNHGEQSAELYSVGAGFEWQFKPVSAGLYYGYALNKTQPRQKGDLQDDGLHFQARWDVF